MRSSHFAWIALFCAWTACVDGLGPSEFKRDESDPGWIDIEDPMSKEGLAGEEDSFRELVERTTSEINEGLDKIRELRKVDDEWTFNVSKTINDTFSLVRTAVVNIEESGEPAVLTLEQLKMVISTLFARLMTERGIPTKRPTGNRIKQLLDKLRSKLKNIISEIRTRMDADPLLKAAGLNMTELDAAAYLQYKTFEAKLADQPRS